MRRYIIPGYIFGVIYGLGHAFIRSSPKADMSTAEWILAGVLISLTVAGAIGAAAGFVVALCQATYRRLKYGRTHVVRD